MPEPWLLDLLGGMPTKSGQAIGPETALKCTAVSCAIRAISEPMGSLPVHIYRRGQNGARERDTSHPAHRLLHQQANPWTSAAEFRTQLAVDSLLHGNGYGFLVRAGGRPRELVRLDPRSVSARLDDLTGEPVYEQTGRDGGTRVLDRNNVIHIRPSLSHDGINGLAPIQLAREAIGVALILESHAAGLFARGARPGGVLSTEKSLNESAVNNVRKIIDAQTSGDNSGRTLILPDNFKFAQMALTSSDAQFLELRRYAVDEIARAFRVPPHLLYEMGRATWGNAEELGSAFVSFTLLFWCEVFQGQFNRVLFTERERETHFVEYMVDDLLRADFTTRAEGVSKLVTSEILNPNEARAIAFNLPPYAGGDQFRNPNTSSS